jgi:hypothetical protein
MHFVRDISSMRYALRGVGNLYHIATERSEVISHLKKYIALRSNISQKEFGYGK